jgi:hypothetical protein
MSAGRRRKKKKNNNFAYLALLELKRARNETSVPSVRHREIFFFRTPIQFNYILSLDMFTGVVAGGSSSDTFSP